jgi:hypothetical protein
MQIVSNTALNQLSSKQFQRSSGVISINDMLVNIVFVVEMRSGQ